MANYAEAQGAESRRDFVHKMRVCLKELRETDAWLRTASRLGRAPGDGAALRQECSELIAIVVTTIKRAKGE